MSESDSVWLDEALRVLWIQLIKEFRSLNPTAAILALSEHADPFSAQRAFRAGARAYLTIDDAPELLRAFDKILSGHPHVAASALPLILSNFSGSKNFRNPDINNLSDCELEDFFFYRQGRERFGISERIACKRQND